MMNDELETSSDANFCLTEFCWEHLQFCDGRVSLAETDRSGFESFRMQLFWRDAYNFIQQG
jgi:hypothetical protein